MATSISTYAELNARSNQFGRYLRRRGVGPGSLVAVCLRRSVEILPVLIGVWKAGAAYVPIDPDYPPDRVGFMLRDSGATLLVTEERLRPLLPAHALPVVCIASEREQVCGRMPTTSTAARRRMTWPT